MENGESEPKKEMNINEIEENREKEEKTMDLQRSVNRRLIELNIHLIQRIKTLEKENGNERMEGEEGKMEPCHEKDDEQGDDDLEDSTDEGTGGDEETNVPTREIALLENERKMWRSVAVVQAIFFFFMFYNYL